MSYSRLGGNQGGSLGRRASLKRYIYVKEMQNDGQLGVAVTCQNLLSFFFFFFFHLRAIKATNFLTKHMEQAA